MEGGQGACWTDVQEHGRWASIINSWVKAGGLELCDFNKVLGAVVGFRRIKLLYNLSDFTIKCISPCTYS